MMNTPLHPLSNLPIAAGIGLRSPHYDDLFEAQPGEHQPGWLEIHPENYFGGGYHRYYLDQAAEHYALSFHAIGLSLGASDPVDTQHLAELKALVDEYNPAVVSDHISWSKSGNAHLNDLLPLPYNKESLETTARNIDQVQQTLGRQILVENPSTYLTFTGSTMSEPEFVMKVAEKSECGLLLDINNIYVQQHNNQLDAKAYIESIDPARVGEIHLAGHIEEQHGKASLLIDTHSQPVKDEVWALYEYALAHLGAVPTLIEWDKDIPEFSILMGEAEKAQARLAEVGVRDAA